MPRYWIELATFENTVLEFDPIRRTVPTTSTRITANITAYSAISCPASSDQSLRIIFDIFAPPGHCQFFKRKELNLSGWRHNARWRRFLSMRVTRYFASKSGLELGRCWLLFRGIRATRPGRLREQSLS